MFVGVSAQRGRIGWVLEHLQRLVCPANWPKRCIQRRYGWVFLVFGLLIYSLFFYKEYISVLVVGFRISWSICSLR
jgi:hypothetical protein